MSLFKNKLTFKKEQKSFTRHYLCTYREVPLWVLAKDLTFGNMSHFFQLMKSSEQNAVCKYLHKTTLRDDEGKRITPHEVLRAYDVLSHFRNLCAHDERLYCAKKGNDTYATMLKLLEVALPKETVQKLKSDIESLLVEYSQQLHVYSEIDLKKQLGFNK